MSAEDRINAAMRVSNFLKDEAVIAALANMKWKNYARFEEADSSEKRVIAFSYANVLKDFANELQVVIDEGELDVLRIAEAAKKARRAPHQE